VGVDADSGSDSAPSPGWWYFGGGALGKRALSPRELDGGASLLGGLDGREGGTLGSDALDERAGGAELLEPVLAGLEPSGPLAGAALGAPPLAPAAL